MQYIVCSLNIGLYGDLIMSADGDHLEFEIGRKYITFVKVFSIIIHAIYAFELFCGLRDF